MFLDQKDHKEFYGGRTRSDWAHLARNCAGVPGACFLINARCGASSCLRSVYVASWSSGVHFGAANANDCNAHRLGTSHPGRAHKFGHETTNFWRRCKRQNSICNRLHNQVAAQVRCRWRCLREPVRMASRPECAAHVHACSHMSYTTWAAHIDAAKQQTHNK